MQHSLPLLVDSVVKGVDSGSPLAPKVLDRRNPLPGNILSLHLSREGLRLNVRDNFLFVQVTCGLVLSLERLPLLQDLVELREEAYVPDFLLPYPTESCLPPIL